MGNSEVKPPAEISDFRKLDSPEDEYLIPEVPQKRKATDVKFSITFAICLGILAIFLIYCGSQSRIARFTHGYDTCGNVCGADNPHVEGIPCSGKNMEEYPYLLYVEKSSDSFDSLYSYRDPYRRQYRSSVDEIVVGDCTDKCDSDHTLIFNRCFPLKSRNVVNEIADSFSRGAGYLVAMCLIGFGSCVGMLLLFRYCTNFIVWIILIGSICGLGILTIILWAATANDETRATQSFAIAMTIFTFGLLFLVIFLFNKIKLVIRIFKESMKAIFGVPLILIEPLLTILAFIILIGFFVLVNISIYTAGYLEPISTNLYDYRPNGVMLFTIWLNAILALWMTQFIIGCQHMVIAGTISSYYFARDKSTLVSPIYNSFYSLIRYHLGTVAFGSLIITIIAIIKALLRSLTNNKILKCLIECCISAIEDFIRYLSKNAYIQTAMHGRPFWESGKRAVRLLVANAIMVVATNSIGDFVLNMAKLLICVFTVLMGYLMMDESIEYFWMLIMTAGIFTIILAHCFFAVFETAIDTIFLCYCEDNSLNDGMSKPYYMSTDLMRYMTDAKQQYAPSA